MSSVDDLIQKIEKGQDGHFLVENREGRAWICVHLPGPGGQPVKKADVLARLRLFGVEDFDPVRLDEIVVVADGQWVEIGSWKEPDSKDADFQVEVAEDHRSATLTIHGPLFRGRWIGRAEIDAALLSAGIRAGVLEDVLQNIVDRNLEELKQKGPWTLHYTIARAVEPIPAENARIHFYYDAHPRAVPALVGDSPFARVDFRRLSVIQTCERDQVLAEILPGREGRPGLDVLGQPCYGPAPAPAKLEAGRNVIDQDGRRLVSGAAGQVVIRHDPEKALARIEVVEVLDLQTVDYSTGHVDFPGTVVIHDTVADGFVVKARGDILVERTVSSVTLQAEGDIVLMGGVVGRGTCLIEAGHDVYARFLQESTVSAANAIYIEDAAMHSRLMAGREIIISGGRGDLIGGTALVGKLLVATTIGSKGEPETKVTLGVDPETLRRLIDLEQEMEKNRSTLQKVEQHRRHIEDARKRGPLTPMQESTCEKLVVLGSKLRELVENLGAQRETLQAMISPDRDAQILYSDTVYPNLEVSFGYGVHRYRVERRAVALPGRFALDPVENRILHSFG